MYGKDARGGVKPFAMRLVNSAQGTVLSPLLVAPANLAESAAAHIEGGKAAGGDDEEDKAAADTPAAQTEHGFWSAKPIWSSEGASTGTSLVIMCSNAQCLAQWGYAS